MKTRKLTLKFILVLLLSLIMVHLGELIYPLETELRTVIRKFEKCSIKFVKSELSIAFNSTCLNENILPKYTYIYYNVSFCCLTIIARVAQSVEAGD